MKILHRALIMLAVAVWLGGLIFFPFVAQSAFSAPISREAAGLIVRSSLVDLHWMGLGSGALLLFLIGAGLIRKMSPRTVYPALCLVVLMLALTSFSQFVLIPRMEAYRVAAGGSISVRDDRDSNRVAFERLHHLSVDIEGGVLGAGLLLVLALAWADAGPSRARAAERVEQSRRVE